MESSGSVISMASSVLPSLAYLVVMMAIYAVGGWVWETAYCSLVERRFVRRGVLYGPACPLYGFAMLLIYYPLLGISDPLALLLMGMAMSTAMEYGTAIVLESAFHRSFWSYDNMPLNVRGRICLPASLTFGGFTLLVRYVLQPAIEPVVDAIPPDRLCDVALVVTLVFFVDVAMSARRWELDTTRMPARVAVVIQRIPESVRTPEEISDLVSDVIDRIRDDLPYQAGRASSARGDGRHRRMPDIHITSARRVANGRLFVTARVGRMKSAVAFARDSFLRLVAGVSSENRGEAIIGRAVMRDAEEEDCED